MFKKLLAIVLSLLFVLSLAACGEADTSSDVAGTSSTVSSEDVQVETVSDVETVSSESEVSEPVTSEGEVASKAESSKSDETSESVASSSAVDSKPISSEPTQSKAETVSKTDDSSVPQHTHIFANATCTESAKCSCGATNGVALGHKFSAATCTAPKICTVCKATEGAALGHTFAEATCSAPKTCTVCKLIEGETLPHDFYAGSCKICKADDPNFARIIAKNGMYSIAVPSSVKNYFTTEGHFDEDDLIEAFVHGGENFEFWSVSFIDPICFFMVKTSEKDKHLDQSQYNHYPDECKRVLVAEGEEYSVICEYLTSLKGINSADDEIRKNIDTIFNNSQEIIASFRWEK